MLDAEESEEEVFAELTPDGGVTKVVECAGEHGPETPPDGSAVKIIFKARLEKPTFGYGTLVDSSYERNERNIPFQFELGGPNMVKGLSIGVASMTRGERARITCSAAYAYGAKGAKPHIPPDAKLTYEVELVCWREPSQKSARDMMAEERLEQANFLKSRANGFFGDGEWREAQEDYGEAVRTLQAGDMPMERRREAWDVLFACWLNEAQCWLKRESWEKAERCCTELLKHNGRTEAVECKGLYRRGVARMALERFEGAREDLRGACMLDPLNREVRARLTECIEVMAMQRAQERSFAQKLFKPGSKPGTDGASADGGGGGGGGGGFPASGSDGAEGSDGEGSGAGPADEAEDDDAVVEGPEEPPPPWWVFMGLSDVQFGAILGILVAVAAFGMMLLTLHVSGELDDFLPSFGGVSDDGVEVVELEL